jgi:hypothetical protein
VTRVDITDEVLEELAAAIAHDRVDDPNNRFAVQSVALDEGHDALVTFILEADAVRYTRALELLGQREG